ncbi:MAG: hypothetical protein ACI9G1_001206 [Pirellulaceae bacterium]|jgi:hypothetical protein
MLPKTAEARTRGLLLPRRKRRAGSNGRGADFVLLEMGLDTDETHERSTVSYIEAVPFKRPNFMERQQLRENTVVRWCRNTFRWFFESFLVLSLVASAVQLA